MAPGAIYTMVIKAPPIVKAVVDSPPDVNGMTDGRHEKEEEVEPEPEPEVNGQADDDDSPLSWEYKLPAPPTPFQDPSISSSLPAPSLTESAVETSTTASRPGSSMSTDSLQAREGEKEVVQLDRGKDLLEESMTDVLVEEAVPAPLTERDQDGPVVKEEVVVLPSSDPLAKQYGMESTTDDVQSPPTSLPPLPSTSPPSFSDEEDGEDETSRASPTDLHFSITTYKRRVKKDSTYDKKLSRSDSPDQPTFNGATRHT